MNAHDAAIKILDWLHKAENDLVGETAVTFNGEAGTVRALKLDEHHGLCFTFEAERLGRLGDLVSPRYYPVSTIRMKS